MKNTEIRKTLLFAIPALFLMTGCRANPAPRLRIGAYFGPVFRTVFPEYSHLGKHCRRNGLRETNGLVYTCKGGFIDIGHLREAADRTAYIAGIVRQNLGEENTFFTFKVIDPSEYQIKIVYPEDWDDLSKKEKKEITQDISIRLGQYFAHTSMIWHEVITWFGYSTTAVFSEHISSFSCEDSYSDVLGTQLGMIALTYPEKMFNEIMTMLIEDEFERLGIQESDVARQAVQEIEGKWYKDGHYFFTKVNKRNFDIGQDDSIITPWLVPEICSSTNPEACSIPNLNCLAEYGFSMELEIIPNIMEKNIIFAIISEDSSVNHIRPDVHFPIIMEYIRGDAYEKYGPNVEIPSL